MHEGSVNRDNVGFNNAHVTPDSLLSGLDPTIVLILNGATCASMSWATTEVRAL